MEMSVLEACPGFVGASMEKKKNYNRIFRVSVRRSSSSDKVIDFSLVFFFINPYQLAHFHLGATITPGILCEKLSYFHLMSSK